MAKQKKKRRIGLFTKIAVVVFSVYIAITLITLQVQTNERKLAGESQKQQLEEVTARNAALKSIIDSEMTDEMIAAQAREKLDLVAPGERVFVDVSN